MQMQEIKIWSSTENLLKLSGFEYTNILTSFILCPHENFKIRLPQAFLKFRLFFIYQCQLKKLKNTIQYSVPFIAEIDMSSYGSGYVVKFRLKYSNSLLVIWYKKHTSPGSNSCVWHHI